MKKLFLTALVLATAAFLILSFGCSSNSPTSPTATATTAPTSPPPAGTATDTPAIPTETITATSTEIGTATVTATVTPTSTSVAIWHFDSSTEGWGVTMAGYTAFTGISYDAATGHATAGSAKADFNFTGTGTGMLGRFYKDISSDPIDHTGMIGFQVWVNIPSCLIDATPPYKITAYLKSDASWGGTAVLTLLSTNGIVAGWNVMQANSFYGMSTYITGVMIEVEQQTGGGNCSGSIYFDDLQFY